MGIACELKRMKDYQIDVEDSVVKLSEEYDYGYKLAKLTIDNVAKVEAMIRTDSRYRKMYDENMGPSPSHEYRTAADFKRDNWDYIGSTAYWMKRISEYPDNTELRDIKFLIGACVLAISDENSVHVDSTIAIVQGDNKPIGQRIMVNRLIAFCETIAGLKECLAADDFSDTGLFMTLRRKISEGEVLEIFPNKTNQKKLRANPSFASKFCHYACYYLLKRSLRDKYSILDSEVGAVLPYYMKRYGVEEPLISQNLFVENDLLKSDVDYAFYRNSVRQVLVAAARELGQRISKNGFDHLIWYYYKNRPYDKC